MFENARNDEITLVAYVKRHLSVITIKITLCNTMN